MHVPFRCLTVSVAVRRKRLCVSVESQLKAMVINSRVARLNKNYVDLPLALDRQLRLNRVAASKFKRDGLDRVRFEPSPSTIQPKRLMYVRF